MNIEKEKYVLPGETVFKRSRLDYNTNDLSSKVYDYKIEVYAEQVEFRDEDYKEETFNMEVSNIQWDIIEKSPVVTFDLHNKDDSHTLNLDSFYFVLYDEDENLYLVDDFNTKEGLSTVNRLQSNDKVSRKYTLRSLEFDETTKIKDVKILFKETFKTLEKPKEYEAGMYKVGKDIPAGEYKLFASGMSYFEVTKDSSGNFNSIISNGMFENFTYITVEDGQYIKIQDAYAVDAKKATAYIKENNRYVEGMYKVGKDIPAGEYKVTVKSAPAYVERARDSKHIVPASTIANANCTSDVYVTVKSGEYLILQDCYIKD